MMGQLQQYRIRYRQETRLYGEDVVNISHEQALFQFGVDWAGGQLPEIISCNQLYPVGRPGAIVKQDRQLREGRKNTPLMGGPAGGD